MPETEVLIAQLIARKHDVIQLLLVTVLLFVATVRDTFAYFMGTFKPEWHPQFNSPLACIE